MNAVAKIISKLLPIYPIYAHCDVPCGIYDPKSAQIAAQTILKMTQKMEELELPNAGDKKSMIHYQNAMVRFVWTKEEHGRKCKEELFILWADYFKPEHLEKVPDLHDTFWKTIKLVSKNKQDPSIESAQELVTAVDKIAEMFAKSKVSK